MKNIKLILTSVLLTGPLTLINAAQVVDLSAMLSAQSAARSLDVDTDTEETIDFSDSTLLYSGGTASIYGGVSMLAPNGGLDATPGAIDMQGTQIRATYSNAGGFSGTTATAIYLWDSADFITSDNVFGSTAGSSFSITSGAAFFNAIDAGAGTRYVIRDGTDYYISNATGEMTSNSGTFSMNGASAGLQWATFTPSLFSSFDTDLADLGVSASAFSAQTFSNVTGVGIIARASRGSFARNEIGNFEVSLIPEPSTYTLLAGIVSGLAYVMFRRRNA